MNTWVQIGVGVDRATVVPPEGPNPHPAAVSENDVPE